MKSIIIIALLAGSSLMAANLDGAKLYKKRCSICHGVNGAKTPLTGMMPLAGRDAGELARKVRAYRDQDARHGVAHSMYEDSIVMSEATYSISNQQISAIATYLSGLK